MAAFQFPDPNDQTTVTNPITGSTYQWKEPPGKWVVTTKVRDVSDIIWEGDNPPDPIGDYKLWYSTDTLELYFYYCDANNVCAWVPTSVPIQVLEDLNAFAAQAELDINQLQYKQQLLQNALDQIYLSVQTGASQRPPIFSDTEPNKHPDFAPPQDELIAGDIWYDTTDPDSLDQYIYDGTNWIEYGRQFVHRKGGDSMEGPLDIEGSRDPDADGIVSTIKVLNVDSGEDSALHLKQNGATKVYVGKDLLTTATNVKFNANNMKVKSDTNTDLFTMNSSGVFYEGAYSADKHIVTKKNLENAIEDALGDLNIGVGEDYYSNLVFKVPVPQSYDMPLLNVEKPHTWTGGGAAGQLFFDLKDGVPFHIGFKAPTNLGPYDEDLAIKFTHDSGVMYARIASRWHSGQVHLNLKDVIGDILVDGEQTTLIEVQDSIFVERAGDSMQGDLVMEDSKIDFQGMSAGATAIKVDRQPGEDVTLLNLGNASANPASSNFYNIKMAGNSFYNGMKIQGGSGSNTDFWEIRSGSGEMKFYSQTDFTGNEIKGVGDASEDDSALSYGQFKEEMQSFRDDVIATLSFGTWNYSSNNITPIQTKFYVRASNGTTSAVNPALVDTLIFNVSDINGAIAPFDRVDVGELFTLSNSGITAKYRVNGPPTDSGSQGEGKVIPVAFVSQSQAFSFLENQTWNVQLAELGEPAQGGLKHTPYISNGSNTVKGVYASTVDSREVAGFYTGSTSNGSKNLYVGNINSYLKCGNKVIAVQTGANSYEDLEVGHDLEFSGIVTVLDRNTGGVLYKNTVTRVQCKHTSGDTYPHVRIWVRDYIGSQYGKKPMFAFGEITDWTNISVIIEGYYLG